MSPVAGATSSPRRTGSLPRGRTLFPLRFSFIPPCWTMTSTNLLVNSQTKLLLPLLLLCCCHVNNSRVNSWPSGNVGQKDRRAYLPGRTGTDRGPFASRGRCMPSRPASQNRLPAQDGIAVPPRWLLSCQPSETKRWYPSSHVSYSVPICLFVTNNRISYMDDVIVVMVVRRLFSASFSALIQSHLLANKGI